MIAWRGAEAPLFHGAFGRILEACGIRGWIGRNPDQKKDPTSRKHRPEVGHRFFNGPIAAGRPRRWWPGLTAWYRTDCRWRLRRVPALPGDSADGLPPCRC